MKTYEVMMSYYPAAALLVLTQISGVEGHSGTIWDGQPILRQGLLVRRPRLTAPVWEMRLLIVVGTERMLRPALPKFEESRCPEAHFSSVVSQLSISAGEGNDGLVGKMDGGSKQELETESAG